MASFQHWFKKHVKPSGRSAAALLITVSVTTILLGCSNYVEQDVNSWLKVRVRTPVQRGIVGFGPAPYTWGYAKINGRWKLIGEGTRASALRLRNDSAALVGFSDETHTAAALFLLRTGDPRLTMIADVLPQDCVLRIPPTGERVDCVIGQEGSISEGYRRLSLTNVDLEGHVGAVLTVDAPDVNGQPGCFHSAIVTYYDRSGIPYFRVRPVGADWHGPRLLAGVFPDGLRAFPMPEESKSELRGFVGGELLEPKKFTAYPPAGPVPP
jgi:hypothetical protein